MIYVISKSTFGDYHVRDIQYNANWDCCPYFDYALIPDNLVDGILATQGYCDITLNSDGTIVESFVARSIPSVPEECQGVNTVLSVNGVKANADGEVALNAADVGAIPQFGGAVNGYLDFQDTSTGLSWSTADGTIIHLRPYSPTNEFQLTMKNPTTGVGEYGVVSINANGTWGFSHPDNVRNAIGAAPASIAEYTPYGGRDNFITNLLHVDLNNPDASCNQEGAVATEDATTLVNSPINSGPFYAYREVLFINNPSGGLPKCIVRLTQSYPMQSNIWINIYDPNIGWSGWEWENPPMADGVAYRTTERYKGKPVYAKAVELSLAGSGFKSVHVADGITEIVSMEGNYYLNWGGVLSEKTANPSTVQLNLASGSLQINSGDMSGTTAKYIVKYTK